MANTADHDEARALILDLLTRASIAHGVYEAEELGGVYDEKWAEWYTDHMMAGLAAGGHAVVRIEP